MDKFCEFRQMMTPGVAEASCDTSTRKLREAVHVDNPQRDLRCREIARRGA
jgi:hypothetical protein